MGSILSLDRNVLLRSFGGYIPANIRVAAKHMQGFMVSVVCMLTMVGMGVDFDLAELAGFYPIDAAVWVEAHVNMYLFH